jgi:AcrR family transcriptional regulator
MKSPRSALTPQARDANEFWKEKRAADIRRAALQTFTEHGFYGASVDEIADRAGIVVGTIYRYYSSKEALFKAVLASFEPITLHEQDDPTTAELTRRIVSGASALGHPEVLALSRLIVMESSNFPELAAEWYMKMFSPVFESVANWIRDAQARGDITSANPTVLANAMLAPLIVRLLLRPMSTSWDVTLPSLTSLAEKHIAIMFQGLSSENYSTSIDA